MSKQRVFGLLHVLKESREMNETSGIRFAELDASRLLEWCAHVGPSRRRRIGAEKKPTSLKRARTTQINSTLVSRIRQQCHKSSTLNSLGHRMLTDGGTTGLATSDNAPVAIGKLFQQIYVFVVDIHRPRPFTVNVQGVFFLGSRRCPTTFTESRVGWHISVLCSVCSLWLVSPECL